MAEALFMRVAKGKHEARSAGTRPAAVVHPEVVEAMREVNVDLSDRVPKLLAEDDAEWAEFVVTMGCGDECPVLPETRYLDWSLDDPAGSGPGKVRQIRDEIARRVDALLEEL
jgi:arsenate reductase